VARRLAALQGGTTPAAWQSQFRGVSGSASLDLRLPFIACTRLRLAFSGERICFKDAAAPASPGGLYRPLEGVTPKAAQGWSITRAGVVNSTALQLVASTEEWFFRGCRT